MASVGGGATGAGWGGSVVWRFLASTSGGKGLDADGGRQYFPAVPEQDADVLEVLIGKVRKDRDVDAVLRKCAGRLTGELSDVLGQAEPCEPIGYFLHRRPRPAEFGLVDPTDG
jgi:hypothetical protein